jgi:hypothetical protein
MKKEVVKKQLEIVNGSSREAIEDLIDTNPSLSNKTQVAIVELKDRVLYEKLMASQRRICDDAVIKIFMNGDIMQVKLLGRYRKAISMKAHEILCNKCPSYEEKYAEYDRQRHCEEIVEAFSQVGIEEYSGDLSFIFGEGNYGYSVRKF